VALIFGSGEPVSRLRRGLDVKGKVNLGLDEVIVPVVQVLDATAPPIRRTPVRWWSALLVVAVVADRGRFRISNHSPIDQLIDGIWISPNATDNYTIGEATAIGGIVGSTAARTTELVAGFGPNIGRPIPIFAFADSTLAASISAAMLRIRASSTVSAQKQEVEIVLPAAASPLVTVANAPTLTLEASTANQTFNVTMTGLYWDSLPLNVRT